jgi:hypothetical protein
MRGFLESLALLFVVLGAVAFIGGLYILVLPVLSIAGASVALGIYVTLSGVGVMLTSGSVYLLALIAESVRRRSPKELELERLMASESTPLSLPPNAR